jgi:hypothetical protein
MTKRPVVLAKRTIQYADYLRRCHEQETRPVSFRRFAEINDEYEREWEIESYEYNAPLTAGKEKEGE